MSSKKDNRTARIQPVPEKRGYEFGGPYVLALTKPRTQLTL